jgi:hypothetical protein
MPPDVDRLTAPEHDLTIRAHLAGKPASGARFAVAPGLADSHADLMRTRGEGGGGAALGRVKWERDPLAE